MKITIHRGANQIGGTCIEIAANNGKKIMIDIGMPLAEDFIEPSQEFMPEIEYAGLEALLISHPHGDHYMLAGFLEKKIPIYIGRGAAAIIEAANSYTPNKVKLGDTIPIENKKPFTIADTFRITPFLTDHSAYDSYMFLIEADGKSVFYTGDFRCHGRKAKLVKAMMKDPPKNIDVMLMEGTNIYPLKSETTEIDDNMEMTEVSSQKSFVSEAALEKEFQNEFENTKGLAVVQSSCQNMDRLVTIYRAAKRAKRELVLPWQVGYIVMQIGNKNLPNFRNFKDVKKFTSTPERPHEIGLETIKKNPEKYVVFLTYPITRALLTGRLFNKDAVYIWSLWNGYKKQEKTAQVIAEIAATNTKIAKDIHASGHADRATIIEFVAQLNPKRLVPVHTAFPEAFKSLEWKKGFTGQVEVHADNEWFEV